MYGFGERLYFMPYFADKDATKSSPVLVFGKKPKSLYQTFVDWFDFAWEKAAPQRVTLSELITPATPCGAALFLTWNEYHVFGISKRAIIHAADRGPLRFYGLGGKRSDPLEPLEHCALREGNEESGGVIGELVMSENRSTFGAMAPYKDNINRREDYARLRYEKREHSGHGAMRVEDDSYYMVGYNASLSKRPLPSREIAALLLLTKQNLKSFSRSYIITVNQILKEGGGIIEQVGVQIPRNAILAPYGTALYMVRSTGADSN
jgi:hypothetical protein